ncbi:rRNA-processing protein utp21 [Malassezia yamatoensis]|uniref:rRNA-processing protein utp21 n=1 Tax=Malassezia yamatoensis TaxID=253288 RepID=A0AAJ5YNK0_9BASI|nr:rRNA-processing protein utp21 [Malassezia yamatoensis]
MVKEREKRAKAEATSRDVSRSLLERTPLYAPFRTIGVVTNGVPFVLQTRFGGKDAQVPDVSIITCVGDAWAMWNADRMTLLFVGPILSHPISSMAASTSPDSLLVAAGPTIHRYIRGRETAKYEAEDNAVLGSISLIGDYLVSLSTDGRKAFVWSLTSGELLQILNFDGSLASCLVHPATYLNKIIIGCTDGSLQLWNIRTGKRIHIFAPEQILEKTQAGIVHLTQTPAVDVLAIAFADGYVSLFDVRLGHPLFSVHVDGGLGSSCVAFRTDGEAHTMAIATRAGRLVIFDLAGVEQNGVPQLLHSVQHAHDGTIGSVEFVPGQPLMLTSGADNAVKQWFFESPTLPPRVLKYRSGHARPPHIIRYYGDDGRDMLTASRDRSLRCLSVVRDSRSFELSQGAVQSRASKLELDAASLKVPPISSISYSTTRSRDWDDLLTTQANDRLAHTWTVRDKHMNKSPITLGLKKQNSLGTAACVSACGNFGLIGTSRGIVDMFNMQSHIRRRTFDTGSSAPVTDVVTDAVNSVCLVSTQEALLHFFDFHTAQKIESLTTPAPVSALRLNRSSNLCAVIGEDLTLSILDLETRRIARKFIGFRGRILDATFSADGRWVVTCSTDSVIRTFDIATAQLVDAFRTSSMATSVTFSPTGDFLATAHVDSVGVHLWANCSQFRSVALRALPLGDSEVEREAIMPTIQGNDLDHLSLSSEVGEPELQRTYTSPPQLKSEQHALLTLTTMPRSRWATLLNLDTIRRRNQPTEAPKKPEKAPFFLDTVHSDTPDNKHQTDLPMEQNTSHRTFMPVAIESAFERRLRISVEAKDVASLFTYLHTLSAPQLDMTIRELETISQQTLFLQALALRLETRCDWEAIEAMLSVFLSVHSESVQSLVSVSEPDDEQLTALRQALRTLLIQQQQVSDNVLQTLDYCMGTLSLLRNVPLL